jgi:hypothetical protein
VKPTKTAAAGLCRSPPRILSSVTLSQAVNSKAWGGAAIQQHRRDYDRAGCHPLAVSKIVRKTPNTAASAPRTTRQRNALGYYKVEPFGALQPGPKSKGYH